MFSLVFLILNLASAFYWGFAISSLVDVCVIGGGIMGSATAAAVTRRGKSCVLVEQFTKPGHGCGSSDGDGRIYRHAYAEEEYLHLMESSLFGWGKLEKLTGKSLLHQTGYIDIAPLNDPKIEDQIGIYRKSGLNFERLDAGAAQQKFPQISIPREWEALYQEDAGVIFATETVQALWDEAKHNGCRFVNDRVSELIPPSPSKNKVVTVKLNSGSKIDANSVVLACGAWTNKLMKSHPDLDVPLPLRISQETICYFEPLPSCPPSLGHTMSELPTFMAHVPNGIGPFGYYGIPIVQRPFGIQGVKVANHCSGASIDPDQRLEWGLVGDSIKDKTLFAEHAKNHLSRLDDSKIFYPDYSGVLKHEEALVDSAKMIVKQIFPYLNTERLVTTSRCLYSLTPDHDFVMDVHPNYPQISVAAGFSGHGFKFGYSVGEIMACLALNEDIGNYVELPEGAMDQFQLGRFAQSQLKYDDSHARVK